MNHELINRVIRAMLAIQRYPWEQGVCAQALYEFGDDTYLAMAHDAVLRQTEDGRLAVIVRNIAVTDPAANGEVVLRAYERTGNLFFKQGADKMLHYLTSHAPKTADGILYHNDVSFDENYTPYQIWADASYMAPPFYAVMGLVEEAVNQLTGTIRYLQEDKTGLVYHIYDEGGKRFLRQKLWATGNGWTLLGIARVLEEAKKQGMLDMVVDLRALLTRMLDSMLSFQTPQGVFHDILDEEDSFLDATSAMMVAACIYRGVAGGYLAKDYLPYADKVANYVPSLIDPMGIIHGVCGCPDFMKEGTSAEAQAAFVMMEAWRSRVLY